MPMRLEVSGMTDLLQKMARIGEKADKVAAEALYEGAGVTADTVSQSVRGIDTQPFVKAQGGYKRKASPEEKAILMKAKMGIAKFKNNGITITTSVGYQNSGYADLNGKRVPIPLIVNSINHGTSFRVAQPFLRKAFSQSKKAAEAAIEAGIKAREKELEIGD